MGDVLPMVPPKRQIAPVGEQGWLTPIRATEANPEAWLFVCRCGETVVKVARHVRRAVKAGSCPACPSCAIERDRHHRSANGKKSMAMRAGTRRGPLIGGAIRTYDEVGRLMGISRSRVQQLEARAIAKLRDAMDSGAWGFSP